MYHSLPDKCNIYISKEQKGTHEKKKEFSQKKKESNSNGKDIHLQSTIPLFVDMR